VSVRNGRAGEDSAGSRRADPAAPGGQERVAGVGPYLAAQRRLRRISLDELADRTRIPRRNLERLEAGAFDAVPDGFSRGFVRSVAEALGLDPDEAVMHLMREPPADDAAAASRRRTRALLARAAVGAVALIALVLLLRLGLSLLAPVARSGPETPELFYRRDAVRSLAEAAREAGLAPRAAAVPESPGHGPVSTPAESGAPGAPQPSRGE
jgi:transcriptional regulator with XRE-family HTH domain